MEKLCWLIYSRSAECARMALRVAKQPAPNSVLASPLGQPSAGLFLSKVASQACRVHIGLHAVSPLPLQEAARPDRALHPDPGFPAPHRAAVGQWVHEIKHDGYRLIARRQNGRVRLFTRRGYDWTERYPRIVEAVSAIRAGSLTIDGEVVCCDANGVSIFEELHSRQHYDRAFLYAFDLLELHGEDFRPQPLHARKARLEKLLARAPAGIQFNEHVEGDGRIVFEHACKLGLEGIVSKHREHPYRSGRTKAWLKIKNPAAPGVLRFKDRT
jgi:bifunctional non-homologous end joining protein LigD